MGLIRCVAIAFTPTGQAVAFLENGESITISAAQGRWIVDSRTAQSLPPLPVVEPPPLGTDEKWVRRRPGAGLPARPVAGEGSRHASIDDEANLLHQALYVRDACRLIDPDDSSSPPALEGVVADHWSDLPTDIRRMAGEQWLSWWHELVRVVAAHELGTLRIAGFGPPRATGLKAIDHWFFDWPQFNALIDRPELRQCVFRSRDDTVRWRKEHIRELARSRPTARSAPIAQRVAEGRQVARGRVRAAIFVLGVSGEWSALPLPGVLLCSASVADDAERMTPLVESAFASAPDAQEVLLEKAIPPSAVADPVVLWATAEASLSCGRVIPYGDGFEVELEVRGDALQASKNQPARRGHCGLERFSGLQVAITFADGRSERVEILTGVDRAGPVMITPFQRESSGSDTLWLWVMPLPTGGPVRLEVTWQSRGIERVSTEFDGELLVSTK